ncbi:MAG: methylmalonyl Co-A mutase-associated GTPase MeaB [Thermomicrobiaceae bacterium]
MTGLLERFRAGDRRALSRILTHVENQTPLGYEALNHLNPDTGNAHIVGLTGPPGAGKSTLANAMIQAIRASEKRIAVVGVDPSSPVSGGAMLGDRIRMLEMQHDDGVYLRSMASRGQVGGLTVAAFGAALILDAFGFDYIVIETVGAGQDEVDIARLADSVVVVQTPGMGDSIQAVKAGILEIADILVVNKADQPGADEVVRDLRQQVRTGMSGEWRIPVVQLSAANGEGVNILINELINHHTHMMNRDFLGYKRNARTRQHARMLAIREFDDFLVQRFQLMDGASDPLKLAAEMINQFARERIVETNAQERTSD